MAVAASYETNNIEQTTEHHHSARSHLRVVDQAMLDAAALLMSAAETDQIWISADELPSLHAVREQSDDEANRLLKQRHELLNEGRFEEVPYAYNPLTTAAKLRKAKREHGQHSVAYQELSKGFDLDVKRHRDEARRRLTWEYFSEVEQPFNVMADSYVYGDYKLKEIVDNGLSPVGSEEVGVDVLIANRREEHTAIAVGKLAKLALEHIGVEKPNVEPIMLTVSQIDNSPQTMIWGLRFDAQKNRRFQEQVGLPKRYITHAVIVEAYKRKKILPQDAQPTEQEILDIQAINTAGEGVLDFVTLLDEIATEWSGKNIFMGEEVLNNFVKDYIVIPTEAAERQAQHQDEVDAIKAEILRLEASGVDGWQANRLIDSFVTNMLLDKVATDPQAALHIFGDKTAHTIEQSMWQRQLGNVEEADRIMATARAEAPPATVCTGGSCGLEDVNLLSEKGRTIASKLDAKPGDTVLRDKERTCKCGRKGTIYYAFNKNKVNKYCEGCGAKESKVTSKAKAA